MKCIIRHPYILLLSAVLAFAGCGLCTNNNDGIITHKIGTLYLYRHTRELHFTIDHTLLTNNAEQLIENMRFALGLCNSTITINNCEQLYSSLQYNIGQVKRDITYIKNHKSIQKRMVFLPILIGVAVWAALTTLTEEDRAVRKKRDLTVDTVLHLNEQLSFMREAAEVNEKTIKDLESILKKDEEKIAELENQLVEIAQFYGALHIISSMMDIHKGNMAKLESIFNGHLKDQLFRIIDITDYEEQVQKLELSLSEGYSLPPFDIIDLANLAKMFVATNETDINIILRLPIVDNRNFTLNELVPVPISFKNDTILVNINSTYFIKEGTDQIHLLSPEMLKDCYWLKETMICNSLVRNSFTNPSKCVANIIENGKINFCGYKIIENKNYFITVSSTSLFVHVVKPLTVKIYCGLEERLINVSTSDLVNFSEYCEILEFSVQSMNDSGVFSSEIFTPTFRPILNIFNLTNGEWIPTAELLSLRDDEILRIINETKPLSEFYEDQIEQAFKEDNDSSWGFMSFMGNPFEFVGEKLKGLMGDFGATILIALIQYIMIPMILVLICWCIVKKMFLSICCPIKES